MNYAITSECTPYNPDKNEVIKPFLFISYAHQDVDLVKPIADALHREGFRIWYDKQGAGISYGKKWHDKIFERLGQSSAFLSFVSQHNEHRPIVIEEMAAAISRHETAEKAIKEGETAKPYPVVFVCLEKVSTWAFELGMRNKSDESSEDSTRVSEFLNENQFINYKQYGGLTRLFMNELMKINWPEGIVDNDWRGKTGKERLPLSDREAVDARSFIVSTDDFGLLARFERMPSKRGFEVNGIEFPFDCCSPDQISHNVAYPTYLDNQWVPEHLYGDDDFKKLGLTSKHVQEEIQRVQRKEIYRCLLSNWQMAVNRAAMWNSKVFSTWYTNGNSERKSLGELITQGAILVCFMKEKVPNKRPSFDYDHAAFDKWVRFCEEYKPTCVRLDWENDESNLFECRQLIEVAFQDFCLTTSSNRERVESLCVALGIADDQCDSFQRRWAAIRDDVVSWTSSREQCEESERRYYTRERLYQEFIIKERDDKGIRRNVADGILDWTGKPFPDKIKRAVDFQYAMNLPLALQIKPVLPADSILQPYLATNNVARQRRREVGYDEIAYAFDQFEPEFGTRRWSLPAEEVNLSVVRSLRDLPSWKKYMSAVSECMERSRLDQIDFGDIHRVWDLYGEFLEAAHEKHSDLNWRKLESESLTIIARFEEHRIIVRYRENEIDLAYLAGSAAEPSPSLPWTSDDDSAAIPTELKRKVNLTISFVCGDAIMSDWSDDVLVAEHLTFDGMTHDNGHQAIDALVNRINIKRESLKTTV